VVLACDGVPRQDLAEAVAAASPTGEEHAPVHWRSQLHLRSARARRSARQRGEAEEDLGEEVVDVDRGRPGVAWEGRRGCGQTPRLANLEWTWLGRARAAGLFESSPSWADDPSLG
jgi:hypothetical protein